VALGFLRKLKKEDRTYEVHRIIKALVDADWLAGMDEKLQSYRKFASDDGS
jgi:hypothetical protein